MRQPLWIVGALLCGALLVGCDNKQKDELAMLKDRNSQLQVELDQAKEALDGSEANRRSLEAANARLQQEVNSANSAASTVQALGSPEIPTDLPAGVSARVEGNSLILDIPGDVLFDSGKATLRSDAKNTLDQIAKSLKSKYPGKDVRVEGFTDSDPIKKSKWDDNWQLAYARARAVGKYLEGKGFSERQFQYVSNGDSRPKSSKKESRRVEIAIVDATS